MYNCKHICVYTRFGADNIFVETCKCFQRKGEKKPTRGGGKEKAQIGTSVRARVFNAGLLARSQFASGRTRHQDTSILIDWPSVVK
jgi:hypothetical protein